MSGLNVEQKAKAYDEALNIARKEYQSHKAFKGFCNMLVHIFPQLEESEDEKIRERLVSYFKSQMEARKDDSQEVLCTYSKWIAWLEKQGEPIKDDDELDSNEDGLVADTIRYKNEHKPTYKAEPKFKEGDWLVHNERRIIIKVVKSNPLLYKVVDTLGYHHTITDAAIENNYHPWTIQDAKDGDVLVCKGDIKNSNGIKYERICLFKTLDSAFFTLTKTSNYAEDYGIDVNVDYPDNTVPATKEQKEILFMAMKEGGYEWSSDKMELRRIGQKLVDKVEPKFNEGDWTVSNLDGKARQISEVHFDEHNSYYVVNGKSVNLEEYDRLHHLWSITDAKDGDVLACNEELLLFKSYSAEGRISLYCWYDGRKNTFHGKGVDTLLTTINKVCPSTKEQHDAFMKTMADAGWKFDLERKALKKIGQSPAEEYSFNIESELFNQLTKEQQELWRKEIEQAYNVGADAQKPSEWSEEDEAKLKSVLFHIEDVENKEVIDWLKSLKGRITWKPTEEQIYWLEWAISKMSDTEKGNEARAYLKELLEELKTL